MPEKDWIKLTTENKFYSGVWKVVAAMSLVITTLFGLLLQSNNDNKDLKRNFNLEVAKQVSKTRVQDSVKILSIETRYYNFLEARDKRLSKIEERLIK